MLNFLMALLVAVMIVMFLLGMFALVDVARQMGILIGEVRNLKQYIIVIEQELEWLQRKG